MKGQEALHPAPAMAPGEPGLVEADQSAPAQRSLLGAPGATLLGDVRPIPLSLVGLPGHRRPAWLPARTFL